MICLRNIRVDTLHKGDTEDNNIVVVVVIAAAVVVVVVVVVPEFTAV
jgi:hypothetical protein